MRGIMTMGLFKKNENEKKNKNEKLLDLNTEKTLSDEDLDKVAGGFGKIEVKAGLTRPKR